MSFYLSSLRLLLLASVLVASCATISAADVGRQTRGARATRIATNPLIPSRRFAPARPLQGAAAWRIRDLGLPAQSAGAPPSTLIPTPYAINQNGEVTLSLCPAAGCGNIGPLNSAAAYVYDYRCGRLFRLAKLAPGSGPAPVDQYIPHALNNRGQVVGAVIRTVGATTVSWPVLWTLNGRGGSTIARIDTTPGESGTAYGINNFGVTVGSVYAGPYQGNDFQIGKAVRFTGGAPVLLAPYANDAYGINDAGVAVGDIEGAAAVFAGGVATFIPFELQCPPAYDVCDQNLAIAINKSGAVLGNFVTNYFDMATQSYVGFLWGGGDSFATLAPGCFDDDCPIQFAPGDSDYVFALNDAADFVGAFDGQPWVSFSPVGDANGLLPPNSGWKIIRVAAINNRRQIVGQGYHAGYGTAVRAFLLEPPS